MRSEVGGRRSEVGGQRSDVRGQRSEERSGCPASGVSRRDMTRIARRFNAGKTVNDKESPEGTTEQNETGIGVSAVPSGLQSVRIVFPALKRRAIFAVSLRDAEANPTCGYEIRIERHPKQTALAFRAGNIEIRR